MIIEGGKEELGTVGKLIDCDLTRDPEGLKLHGGSLGTIDLDLLMRSEGFPESSLGEMVNALVLKEGFAVDITVSLEENVRRMKDPCTISVEERAKLSVLRTVLRILKVGSDAKPVALFVGLNVAFEVLMPNDEDVGLPPTDTGEDV